MIRKSARRHPSSRASRRRDEGGNLGGLDHETVGGYVVARDNRRGKWVVIRRGEIVAEATTKEDAMMIARPGSLFSVQPR
jgi:hypothetical protein